MPDLDKLSGLRTRIAIAGIGESDYVADYAASRSGPIRQDSYGYAATAFERALADCGLAKDDIDGLIGGPALAAERTG